MISIDFRYIFVYMNVRWTRTWRVKKVVAWEKLHSAPGASRRSTGAMELRGSRCYCGCLQNPAPKGCLKATLKIMGCKNHLYHHISSSSHYYQLVQEFATIHSKTWNNIKKSKDSATRAGDPVGCGRVGQSGAGPAWLEPRCQGYPWLPWWIPQ